ncbi:MAG: glucosaminidase domain-containing protein [Duncaniella sp.]|uniref:glucosaminidase domain-containing protein n=1 Tax=Duncaniella sp. TaxID=2518496 RepID=UPI0023D7014B|nr:glucosaminidase domain-containing protein [Duncaniella sp.]MDE6090053.1 glucosaminidase domain-containing protein [Duncaniella sp.]
MLRLIFPLLVALMPLLTFAKTPIFGKAEVEAEQMYDYVRRHNPDFEREVAEAFYRIGERYGVRGDIALCQAIIETGWFRFDNGTAVKAKSHNYCGLGVKKRGDKGCHFSSIDEGVTAMIQHLYAYACAGELPEGEKVVDPRFGFVQRGCAPTWEKLAGRWAMNPHYGHNILRIYTGLSSHARSGKPTAKIAEGDLLDGLGPDFQHDIDDSVDVADIELFR